MRDPRLVGFAKAMRREMTEPEKLLWYELRAKRFDGVKFRRQNVVGNYIADFYSRSANLIVEADGDTHGFQHDYDLMRERFFNSKGFIVIRFTNLDILTNMAGVMATIAAHLNPPLLTLSPEGERAL